MFRYFTILIAPDFNKLHVAASKGNVRSVNTLLEAGANVNFGTEKFVTPLHFASQHGHLQVVKSLIEKGANLNSTTDEGFTPLHLALQQRQRKVSEFLINEGSDVNACDDQNWTPLHNVCFNGFSLAIVQALLDHGTNIHARDTDGKTALHLASEFNHVEIVNTLIENGANVNAFDKRKWTPLHCAAYDGSFEAARSLISKVSDVDAKTERKTTPLHFAVDHGHLKVVEALLENRADVNAQDHTQWTPLHFAAEKGYVEVCELLLQYGADVNLKDNQKGTALHLAVQHEHPTLVNVLLQHELDVNAKIDKEATPLHLAAQAGCLEMVKALLNKGAYFDAKAKVGPFSVLALLPTDFAKLRGNTEIIRLLELVKQLFDAAIKNDNNQLGVCIREGAIVNARDTTGKSPLHYSVSNDNIDAIKTLLQSKADVTQITNEGITALHMAATKGNGAIVKALVEYAVRELKPIKLHCFINAKITAEGSTALHIAAQKNDIEIVRLLLKSGAAYNNKNKKNKVPSDLAKNVDIRNIFLSVKSLFVAVKAGHEEKVTQLLQKNEDIINSRDTQGGATPLYWAVHNDHHAIAQLLLESGSDLTFVTNKGNTPLHMASSKGNNQDVKLLLQHLKSDKDKLNLSINTQTTISSASALHIASNLDVAKSLLQHGAIYNIKNKEGKTPLDLAKSDIKKLLELTNELFERARTGKINIINRVKELEPDIFAAVTCARNRQEHTLLQVSTTAGLKYISKELLGLMKRPM